MLYFVKTPDWLKKLFPKRIWEMSRDEKRIYLTFDDGPHPIQTTFVLDLLKQFNAKATFFCIGKNVRQYTDVYKRIIDEGHAVGNHTNLHLNGKKTDNSIYINDVNDASKVIDSRMFRPPYGRMKSFQANILTNLIKPYKIVMWTVLSGDFDKNISPERCTENVLFKTGAGSIVVFHDSEKAAKNMRGALSATLKSFSDKGFTFEKLLL